MALAPGVRLGPCEILVESYCPAASPDEIPFPMTRTRRIGIHWAQLLKLEEIPANLNSTHPLKSELTVVLN
jgi:hypothetical protein